MRSLRAGYQTGQVEPREDIACTTCDYDNGMAEREDWLEPASEVKTVNDRVTVALGRRFVWLIDHSGRCPSVLEVRRGLTQSRQRRRIGSHNTPATGQEPQFRPSGPVGNPTRIARDR